MQLREGTYQLGSSEGWVRINTFKEGLLSRMGHDLTLEVAGAEIACTVSSSDTVEVTVTLPKETFQVIAPSDLSAKDRTDIQKNIRKHLPGDPTFSGTIQISGQGGRLQGQAKVGAGQRSAPISASIRLEQQRVQAEIELSHSALHFKPFRAPLGVIRLQDRLVLSFSLDLSSLVDPSDA